MALFLPRRWRSQPQYSVEIDPKWLPVIGINPAVSLARSTRNTSLTVAPGVSKVTESFGLAAKFAAASEGITATIPAVSPYPMSFVFVGRSPVPGNFKCLGSLATASDNILRVTFQDGAIIAQQYNGAEIGQASVLGLNYDYPYIAVAVFSSSSSVSVYAKNLGSGAVISASNSTLVAGITALTRASFGVYWGSSFAGFSESNIGFAQWLRVALSQGQINDLLTNPWSLFKPQQHTGISGSGSAPVVGSAKAGGGGAAKAVGITDSPGFAKAAGGGAAKAVGTTNSPGFAKAAGGGAAKAVGSAAVPVVGSAKSAGGGAAKAVGSTDSPGFAKAAGGGSARAQGTGAVVHTAAAAGGGAAKTPQGVPGYASGTVRSAGGGAASAFGVQNVGIVGTARAAGGGCAISPTLANRIGWAVAGGGGAAKAVAQSATHAGTAAAAGGGAASAYGSIPPPPGIVDHYVKGWPVSASGAVIVHLVP